MKSENNRYYTLITGASAGIGKQIAIEFARRNHNLFLISLPKTGLEIFARELQKKYMIDVKCLCIDLTKYGSPQKVFLNVKRKDILINILVNNAGIGYEGEFEKFTIKQIDEIILLNIRVLTLLTFLFLPDLKSLDKAYILNISSFAGRTPIPYKCLYSASKGFIWYFTQALNVELKNSNINVLTVYPSGVRTNRIAEKIKQSHLLARITVLKPEYVAQAAVSCLLKGKQSLMPGIFTKFYYAVGYILPQGLVLKLTSTIFRKYN